jgi:hypothetical protein
MGKLRQWRALTVGLYEEYGLLETMARWEERSLSAMLRIVIREAFEQRKARAVEVVEEKAREVI